MKSWKTTSAGILAILAGLTSFIFAAKAHNLTNEVIAASASGILMGIGLIFAKDSNVTGGTVVQSSEKK